MTYADAPAPGRESGVDLAALDEEIKAIFDEYFRVGSLDAAAVDELEQCEVTLIRVVPTLVGDDRQYFAMALSIAQWILEIQAGTEGQLTT